MKKLIMLFAVLMITQFSWAVDQSEKRRNIVRQAEIADKQIVDGLNTLKELRDERIVSGNFLDSDFSSTTDLVHLDSTTVGILFDFVVPNLDANYQDAANGGRNKQILLQVHR